MKYHKFRHVSIHTLLFSLATILIIFVISFVSKAADNNIDDMTINSETVSAETYDKSTVQDIDTEPPVIYGVRDLVVQAYTTVDFTSEVYAVDNEKPCPVIAKSNSLNMNVPGIYYITYSAVDKADNRTDREIAVSVTEQGIYATEDEIHDIVETTLSAIIHGGMTNEEKCEAVYDYLHSIPYTGVEYSDIWQQDGYCMLTYLSGDCFGYYSASRLLLEALGFKVLRVTNNNGFNHTWCLVSIDDGNTWRHFDPTCWRWGSDGYLCLVTDIELTEYGWNHQVGYETASHDWERQQYPEAH